jgi:LAO/AO transport system kinase
MVVEAPGLGDDIQAIKAGILEIADIFVVNKADQAGADNTVRALESMLQLSSGSQSNIADLHHGFTENISPAIEQEGTDLNEAWEIPVVKTSTTERMGIDQLFTSIMNHKAYLHKTGLLKTKNEQRMLAELHLILSKSLFDHWRSSVDDDVLNTGINNLLERKVSPQELADQFVKSG